MLNWRNNQFDHAMKKSATLFILMLCTAFTYGASFTSVTDGDWNLGATWGNLGNTAGVDYPSTGDDVTISHVVTYNINVPLDFNSLTLSTGGHLTFDNTSGTTSFTTFNFNGGTFETSTNSGIITIDNSLSVNGTLDVKSTMNINGDFTINSGSVSFSGGTLLRVQSSKANVNINSNMSISAGVFAVNAQGSNTVTINGSAVLTVGSSGAFYFEGSGSANFTIDGQLIVENGGQVINNSGAHLNVTNNGTIRFEWGSSYFEGLSAGKISITGNRPTFEISLTSGGQWRQIGSPFESGTTLSVLTGTDFNPNISSGQENIYYWDATVASTGDDAPGWTAVTDLSNAFDATTSSRAYNIYTGGANYPFANSGVVSFDDVLVDMDSRTFTLYNSMDPDPSASGTTDQGWNLVYNPFPFWIDLRQVLNDGANSNLTYQGVHIWDAPNNQYVAHLYNGESLISHTNQTVTDTLNNRRMNPFQAFWVKLEAVDNTTESLTLSKTHRTAIKPDNLYLKTNNVLSRVRLNTFAVADSAWDQVLITINPTASESRLGSEDGYDRAPGFGTPNMTLVHQDGSRLCIDTRPLDSSATLDLDYTNAIDGQDYYIDLDTKDCDPAMSVILEDVKTGTMHDMESGPYLFSYDVGWGGTRFRIHLNKAALSDDELVNMAKPEVWFSSNILHVRLGSMEPNTTIQELDLAGRIVGEYKLNLHQGLNQIPLEARPIGTLRIFRIASEQNLMLNLKTVQK